MDKKAFLLSQKNIAVIGVTLNKEKYGYQIYQCLKQNHFNTYGVSIKYKEIDHDSLYPNLESIPTKIDLAVFVVAKKYGYAYVDACHKLHISTIWLQPGTYDQELLDYIHSLGIQTIEDCVLVQLNS